MNHRKCGNSLSVHDRRAIMAADAKATRLGLPLNVLISFHPRDTLTMALVERLAEFKRIRDNYCQFGRQNGFERAWLYVREIALPSMAEHMHLLCHVPRKLKAQFIANACGWGREPDACHACDASTAGYWSRCGKRFSALLYICKQMSPQAAFHRPYWRIPGGPIEGARWGASRNIKGG
ncbi:MAG: hypothetical protein IOC64_07640 [Methylobacterium sp.]|nr:hypothetical protein [Methylobacterium sp.]MCA3601602.1 hypothetical protein [Methylobacterium sp.]MCA3606181.1 hypothetical protein [Methylobacterium sp.]MCA3609283.1 hypothetical protein [Methylobacterium sp.]MCA3618380.1 hypothetical protein [Methylobacterium sp.]